MYRHGQAVPRSGGDAHRRVFADVGDGCHGQPESSEAARVEFELNVQARAGSRTRLSVPPESASLSVAPGIIDIQFIFHSGF
jgi:hypothetical protein